MEVLIIDDDLEDREILSEAVTEVAGYASVHCASTPQEAMEKIQTLKNLRFIFLDGKLPGMSGLELLHQIRRNQVMANIKIIVYSGFSSSDLHKDFLREGANMVMEKTSSYQYLVEKLTNLFSVGHKN